MSVLLETSLGDIVIDLHTEQCPNACRNFLKLCKIKYYNYSLFHNVQPGSLVQTGDPTGTGQGGQSVYGVLYGPQARFFEHKMTRALRHDKPGVVSMAASGPCTNGSQFFITVDGPQEHLDDKYTIFGQVAEGLEVARAISAVYADADGRPYKNVRIRHTIILEDPFEDPPGLEVPDASPPPSDIVRQQDRERLAEDEDETPLGGGGVTAAEAAAAAAAREAKSRAEVLEMLGDLPDADIEPPKNVLFVCKLNPVTEDEDLDIIFGRFGNLLSCEVIRDPKTGDSLNYAFIEFESEEACSQAYFKMDGALIDDRRIHVDFSQSVSHLWNKRRRNEAMPNYDQGRGGGSGDGGNRGGGGRGGYNRGGAGGGAGDGRGGGGGRGGEGGPRGSQACPRLGSGGVEPRGGDYRCQCGTFVFDHWANCHHCGEPRGAPSRRQDDVRRPGGGGGVGAGGGDGFGWGGWHSRDKDASRDGRRDASRDRDASRRRDASRDASRDGDASRRRDTSRDASRDRSQKKEKKERKEKKEKREKREKRGHDRRRGRCSSASASSDGGEGRRERNGRERDDEKRNGWGRDDGEQRQPPEPRRRHDRDRSRDRVREGDIGRRVERSRERGVEDDRDGGGGRSRDRGRHSSRDRERSRATRP